MEWDTPENYRRRSEPGLASEKYVDMVRRGRVNDPYVAAWLKKHG